MNLQQIQNLIERNKGIKQQIENNIVDSQTKLSELQRQQKYIERAQIIIQTVAQQTQEQLRYHISEIVSLALETVFPYPYKFNIEFVIQRGKTEAIISFIKDNQKINPMSAAGGGLVDIAAFALRIALWNLTKPKNRNTLILDEPFRFVSQDLQENAYRLLQEISGKLNIQFIMITHSEIPIKIANKVFRVVQKNGISKIAEVIENDKQ